MLQIYNSLTHQKETFVPLVPGKINLYVCGLTVYDYSHIGHARIFVAFDIMVRFLRESGWDVKYVRNITDIDDKIIKRAQENGEDIHSLTERFIRFMHEDENALNVLKPDLEPRATQTMDQIIQMIQLLQDKGFAYVADNGDVYFQVDQFKNYGKLSRKDLDQMKSGARVEIVEEKKSPLDFVLWKKAKPGEINWPSPWGDGRPGWHIECSAMSTYTLGETFDIHGGGSDLLFPHHENELAQSECATGKKFVNYWVHSGHVQVNKEKMSKSLHNFFTIRDVVKEYDPEVIRYFLMSSHYRSPVNYSDDQLIQAKSAVDRLYTSLRGVILEENGSMVEDYQKRFFDAMNDDFNTPVALSVLFDCVSALNTAREKNSPEVSRLAHTLKKLASILGLLDRSPDVYWQGETGETNEIEKMIFERETARKNKDWAKADEIRLSLEAMGIVLEDVATGTIWKRKRIEEV